MVNCADIGESLDLYIDGELAELERAELESHVGACEACRDRLQRRQGTRRELRTLSDRFSVSTEFQARLQCSLAEAKQHQVDAPVPAPRRATHTPWRSMAAAAVVLAVGGAAWAVAGRDTAEAPASEGEVLGAAQIRLPVVSQSVRWHRRQVPVEVTGPVAADVQDWFAGKVDFAVRAPMLGEQAHLLGGRLGYVDQTEAAVLVYDVGGEKLSVLVFDPERVPSMDTLGDVTDGEVYVDNSEGFSVAVQRRGGLGYTYTSGMPEAELVSLVREWR